ncbi:MAG: DUF58 domain-containing protein [Nocardioidaceae bacterium]
MSRLASSTRVHPTWRPGRTMPRAALLIAALAAVLALRPGTTAALSVTAAVLVTALLAHEQAPPQVDVDLRCSTDRCTAGEVVEVSVAVRVAEGVAPLVCSLFLEPAPAVEPAGLLSWQSASDGPPLRWLVRPTSWRHGSLGDVSLLLTTRTGSSVCRLSIPLPTVTVHPRRQASPGIYAPPQLLARTGTHTSRGRGAGMEFAELRPYASGDPLRHVDWKSSARTGELMVSQRHREQSADVVLFVDHIHDRRSRAIDEVLLDKAVLGAASLARAYLAAGDRVGVVMFGSSTRWLPPGQGKVHEQRLLDSLVLPPATSSDLDPDLVRVPGRVLPPRAIVFCFSPLLEERMLGAIARLAERGHRLVVVDTAGLEPAVWPPGTPESVRQRWRAERERVRMLLAGVGAVVVDDLAEVATAVRGMTRLAAVR